MAIRFFLMALLSMGVVVLGCTQSCSTSNTLPAGTLLATPTQLVTVIPTSTPQPMKPEEVLLKSGETMGDLESFKFLISHIHGGTPLMANLILEEADGYVVRPSKISTKFSGSFGGYVFVASLVSIGNDTYMTNPLTDTWGKVSTELNPYQFFNPGKGIKSIISEVKESSFMRSASGYEIVGKIPSEALEPLLGSTVKGSLITVNLKFDNEFHIIEALLEGRATALEPNGTIRLIKLSRFNEPFDIQPPQIQTTSP